MKKSLMCISALIGMAISVFGQTLSNERGQASNGIFPPHSADYATEDRGGHLDTRVLPDGIHDVKTGFIDDWFESGHTFAFDNYVSNTTDIVAWWSLASSNSGWFYGYNASTKVAIARGVTDITQVTDASVYAYEDWSVGPVRPGEFVLFYNTQTRYYAAFKVDRIYQTGALISITWYFQADGSADFSSFSPALAARFITEGVKDGVAPYTIQFTDLSTSADALTITSWEWDFDNDGIIDSREANPSWTYVERGVYSIGLTVSDNVHRSTYVREAYINVFENTALLVLAQNFFRWSTQPVFSRRRVNSGLPGACPAQIGYADFDQTWGPIQVPSSKKIAFSHFEVGKSGQQFDVYIVEGTDPSGAGSLIYSETNLSSCGWSDAIVFDLSFLRDDNFYLRIDNSPPRSFFIAKFRIDIWETPSEVLVVNSSALVGESVNVPIQLTAQGNENALGFSLHFDPAILSAPQIQLGGEAQGATLITNTNSADSGRLGITLALPTGLNFAAGTREIAVVTFTINPATTADSTRIDFDDLPVAREVVDAEANVLQVIWKAGTITIDIINSVHESAGEQPSSFELGSNFPNPFNPETIIAYAIPAQASGGVHVSLRIYNLQGQLVRTLVNQMQQAGRYAITWDGRNEHGQQVASGTFIYQLHAGNFLQSRKMALLR